MSHVAYADNPGGAQKLVVAAGRRVGGGDAAASPGSGLVSSAMTGQENIHDEESLVTFEEA